MVTTIVDQHAEIARLSMMLTQLSNALRAKDAKIIEQYDKLKAAEEKLSAAAPVAPPESAS